MPDAARPRPPASRWSSSRHRRVVLPALVVLLLAVAGALGVALQGGSRPPPRFLESLVQDDDHLLYAPTPVVKRTLDELRRLGADRLRLTILWSQIAPAASSRSAPAGFDARDPAAYPAGSWFAYDRIVLLARASGLKVDFDLTAPGPLWAMASPAPSARVATHLRPDPRAFAGFVAALGRRYDGRYSVRASGGQGVTLPRVTFWTIWNEPNQPGWLYPQWREQAGRPVMEAPVLYRRYVDAAFSALSATGHTPAGDTILIGELAPEGSKATGPRSAIAPLPFLRALYCVDGSDRPLHGGQARALACPRGGDPSGFVGSHPGLFAASGFAHHPYSFFLPPATHLKNPGYVPLADLARLERALDRIMAGYGVNRSLPLYLTEYGYETDPPNPYRGVSLARQSRYLNQALYMAAQDPRVRAMAQFLLLDSPPDTAYPRGSFRYWSTFQTGLRFADGRPKPSLRSYRLPIFVPRTVVAPGGTLEVWGMLRAAANFTHLAAMIQWRPLRGAYRTLARVATADPAGILTAQVAIPGAGAVRILWTAPGGEAVSSRAVGVSIR